MRKTILYSVLLTLSVLCLASCNREKLSSESVIKDSYVELTPFDYWLESNLLRPYNIEFKYRFSMKESDLGIWSSTSA